MAFTFFNSNETSASNYVEGQCWSKDESYFYGHKFRMPLYGINVDDELKYYNAIVLTIRYKYGEIPNKLSEKADKYFDSMDCILGKDDRNCAFYVERNFEDWNEE